MVCRSTIPSSSQILAMLASVCCGVGCLQPDRANPTLQELGHGIVERAIQGDFASVGWYATNVRVVQNIAWLAREEPDILARLVAKGRMDGRWSDSTLADSLPAVYTVAEGDGLDTALTFTFVRNRGVWKVSELLLTDHLQQRADSTRVQVLERLERMSARAAGDVGSVLLSLVVEQLDAVVAGDFFTAAAISAHPWAISDAAILRKEDPTLLEAARGLDTVRVDWIVDHARADWVVDEKTGDSVGVGLWLRSAGVAGLGRAVDYDFVRQGDVWMILRGPNFRQP